MTTPPNSAGVVVQRFDDAWQRGDVEALMTLVADDCVYDASVGPGPGRRYAGRDEVRRGFVEMLAYDQAAGVGGELVMLDDRRALMVWTVRRSSPLHGTMDIRGCDLFEVRGGLICRKDAFRKCFS